MAKRRPEVVKDVSEEQGLTSTARNQSHGTHSHIARRLPMWPTTQLGWWAVILAVASIVLVPSWKLMGPEGAIPGLSCALAGGLVALVAMFRLKERAITLAASLVPFLFAVLFLAAELILGHS